MVIAAAAIAGAATLGAAALNSSSKSGATKPDFWSGLINQIRAQDLEYAKSVTGGLGGLLQPRPDIFSVSPEADPFRQAMIGFAQQQGLDPTSWFSNASNFLQANQAARMSGMYDLGNMYMGGMENRTNAAMQGVGGLAGGYMQDIANYNPLGNIEGYGAQQGQNYLNQIVAPQIQNQMAMMGLGRSGAAGEAMAKAGASIALPLAQQVLALRGQQAGQQMGIRGQLAGQGLGLQGQLAGQGLGIQGQLAGQNIANQQGLQMDYGSAMNNLFLAQPNIDVALREAYLNRLNTGYNAADMPRQLALQQYQTQLGSYLNALNQAPFNPGQTNTQSGFNFNGAALQGAGAAGLNLAALYSMRQEQQRQQQTAQAVNSDPTPKLFD